MSIFFQKFSPLYGTIKPFLSFFNLVVEHREKPYFSSLEPNKLVGVEYVALSVEACEITSMFFILRKVEPKWYYIVKKLTFILSQQCVEIFHKRLLINEAIYGVR